MDVIDAAAEQYELRQVWALFSGGHDSLVSTHIASKHHLFRGAVHINTGIGIEETRLFVRETCARFGWALREYHPDAKNYEDLIREQGFPSGPKSHNSMYYWLKQRQVRRFLRENKTHRRERIGLVTGIRAAESVRRRSAKISVPIRVDDRGGCWINPILEMTGRELNSYIEQAGLPRNLVSDTLHRSGECLCGALANPDELPMIATFYPAAAKEIHRLEQIAEHLGLPAHWATRTVRERAGASEEPELNPLCASCQADLPVRPA